VIGVVTTSYPRNAADGAGGFVRQRVRELRQQGQWVEILAAGDREDAGENPAADEEAVTRIEAWGLFYTGGAPDALESENRMRRLGAWVRAAGFSLAMLSQLCRRGRRWQAVESHWLLPCGLLTAAVLPRLPHRSHVHGGDLYLLRRMPFGDSLARSLCRSGPELVFASVHLLETFADLTGCRPEVLGARCRVRAAPFDTSIFYPRPPDARARLRARLGFARPTVLAAGRLVPVKGFDILISALADIPPPARPDLLIAGDGPERTSLVHQAQRAGVQVQFPGTLAQPVLARAMAAADLFVHPCRVLADGRGEGMPLVVREALACGGPVIACASGGVRELSGSPGLLLLESGDVAGLSAAIRSELVRRCASRT
jgi:glycosyltransferase involved in cell wall biosynthesis